MLIHFLEVVKPPAEIKFLEVVEWSSVPTAGDDLVLDRVHYTVERRRWEVVDGTGRVYVYLKKKGRSRKG